MVAERCWWGGRRFGKNGLDRQWRAQSGGEGQRTMVKRAMEQATILMGRRWVEDMERDKVYDKG